MWEYACVERFQDNMKYCLADALKRCMKRAPLEKITVGEIAEECGTARQKFYRHFKDKYDLVNWYFDKIPQESIEQMVEGRNVFEGLVNKLYYYEEEGEVFQTAFKNDAQNNLW